MSVQAKRPSLSEYFDSSYESLQQEISLFIKGFPIINMQEFSSINGLVGSLIKQNSLLSTRFKEQVSQIKDNYKRSEQVISQLRRKNMELETLCGLKEEQNQRLMVKERQEEEVRDRMQKQIESYKEVMGDNVQKEERIKTMSQSLTELKSRFMLFLAEIQELKPTKVTDSFKIRTIELRDTLSFVSSPTQPQTSSQQLRVQNEAFEQQTKELLDNIEQKAKGEKAKVKGQKQKASHLLGVCDQIWQVTNDFNTKCRETIRISKLTNTIKNTPSLFLEGFEAEVLTLEKRLEVFKAKISDVGAGTGKRTVDTSSMVEIRREKQSFESALLKVVEMLEKPSPSQDIQKEIRLNQKELQRSFKEIEAQCRRDLQQFSQCLRTQTSHLVEEIKLKEKAHGEYERSLVESRSMCEESQRLANETTNQNLELNQLVVMKNCEVAVLQQTIQDLRSRIDELEQKREGLQHDRCELEIKLEQSVMSIANPLKEELTRLRQELQQKKTHHLTEKEELLESITAEKHKNEELMMSLVRTKEDKLTLTERIASHGEQIAQMSKMLSIKDKEIDSLGEMIRELETKVRCQAIDLRGKEFQLHEGEKRIKELISENHTNFNNLKEIRGQIPVAIQLKNDLMVSEHKLGNLSEENLRLKMLLKDTKVELSNARKAISELSNVINQHEQLKRHSEACSNEAQRYRNTAQDTQTTITRQNLEVTKAHNRIKELEKYQIETLTLQAENNRLLIETRHMKNVLGRISELKEYV